MILSVYRKCECVCFSLAFTLVEWFRLNTLYHERLLKNRINDSKQSNFTKSFDKLIACVPNCAFTRKSIFVSETEHAQFSFLYILKCLYFLMNRYFVIELHFFMVYLSWMVKRDLCTLYTTQASYWSFCSQTHTQFIFVMACCYPLIVLEMYYKQTHARLLIKREQSPFLSSRFYCRCYFVACNISSSLSKHHVFQ